MNQQVICARVFSLLLFVASLAGAADDMTASPQNCSNPALGQVGQVLQVKDGVVVIARDETTELGEGKRVGFRNELGDERIVGTVVRVNNKTYHVRVHINEEVFVGEIAYMTVAPPTGSLVAPPRSPYVVEAALALKPWLGLGQSNSGVLIEGHLAWQVNTRFRLTAAAAPAVPSIGATAGALEAYVAPSVTFDIAEMGLGFGVGTHNFDYIEPQGFGLLLSPILRIGPEDGLRFRARSSAVVSGGVAQLGSFRIDAAIPVHYGARLLVGGGGGNSGYAYGEVGLELLLVGNGLGGSWFGSGLFGYGGVNSTTAVAAFGPYMGLEVKRRF